MKLFLDNNLSPRIAASIAQIVDHDGHEIVALKERFSASATDQEWIEALGREGGWSILSLDKRIAKDKALRALWRRSNVVGFFLEPQWQKLTVLRMTAHIMLWFPLIDEQSRLVRSGSAFLVPVRPGSRLKPLPL